MTTLSITMTILSAGVVVLVMRGALTRRLLSQWHQAVDSAIAGHRPTELHLDFAAVEYADLEAVADVVRTAGTVSSRGTRLVVCNPSDHVRRQFDLAGGIHLLR